MDKNQELFDKGVGLLRSGNLKKALDIFDDLVKREPENADYWSERGVVYFHLNQKKESLLNMDEAVKLQANKSYRYSSRAYIRGHYKMTKEAIADYEKAIELDPEDAIAQNNLGLLQEQLGYKKEAKKRFEIADNLMEDPKGRMNLGIQGEQLKARNIQKEIDEEKRNQSLWNELKSIVTKEGRASFLKFIKSGFKKP